MAKTLGRNLEFLSGVGVDDEAQWRGEEVRVSVFPVLHEEQAIFSP